MLTLCTPNEYYELILLIKGWGVMTIIQNPVQIITQRMATANQSLQIDYPVVIGMANTMVQHTINSKILALINKLIKESGYYDTATKTTVQIWYEIKSNERGILSLSIGMYYYADRAAHGMTVIKSLTFNIHDGKVYKLADLFKPGCDYIKVLSDIIKLQIKERDLPLIDDFKAIDPNQDYYIADKALVVYFQLYELTPYAYGLPFFPISVYQLSDIIKEDGPLGKMAASY